MTSIIVMVTFIVSVVKTPKLRNFALCIFQLRVIYILRWIDQVKIFVFCILLGQSQRSWILYYYEVDADHKRITMDYNVVGWKIGRNIGVKRDWTLICVIR